MVGGKDRIGTKSKRYTYCPLNYIVIPWYRFLDPPDLPAKEGFTGWSNLNRCPLGTDFIITIVG